MFVARDPVGYSEFAWARGPNGRGFVVGIERARPLRRRRILAERRESNGALGRRFGFTRLA